MPLPPPVNWHGPLHVLFTTPPIIRVALPGMRDFDGVRHFLEFYPPLVVLAASGLCFGIRLASELTRSPRVAMAIRSGGFVAASVPCLIATAATHPNGTCYFNSWIGGMPGAASANLDAIDYWGNSYWRGLRWLNDNAAPNATLVVPVALREDIRFVGEADGPSLIQVPLYAMYITRPGMAGPMLNNLIEGASVIVHEIAVDDVVILKIIVIDDPAKATRAATLQARTQRAKDAIGRLYAWILEEPEQRFLVVWKILIGVHVPGFEAAERQLHAVLPQKMRSDGTEVLWLILNTR